MLAKVNSGAVLGIDAYVVEVEADVSSGLPAYATVGLPEGAVKESKERVASAIKNSGYSYPLKRVTINLAPADIKKEGAAFDLPIAVGILAATAQASVSLLERTIILGELSLDGSLRPIRGALPITAASKEAGFESILLPTENANEAGIVEGIDVLPVANLKDTVALLGGDLNIEAFRVDAQELFEKGCRYAMDYSEVKGQAHAKRALEVAAAGGHNIIMIGPPGSGKTMLAKRIPTILPRMTLEEALETTKIHSVTGLLTTDGALVAKRPFRPPHHTISDAGLIGGGTHPRPGEVSLAHNGVLFLDELPEFNKNVLEVLRQPLEDGRVTIARAAMSLTYPARFMLAAAMNPCPCGYYTDPSKECTCTPGQIAKYMSKISGPLLDRIDIHIEVPALRYKELSSETSGEKSSNLQARVDEARGVQLERYRKRKRIYCNAHLGPRGTREYCKVDSASHELLRAAITKFGLSARAYDRILKVARTIADLEGSEEIGPAYISEAIQYRSLDRHYPIPP
ncbi:MAG: YifB family Mg chelatase-like AAA ATPase [bacterium]